MRLPEPTPEERDWSDALAAVIRAEIGRSGPMDFQRYMQLCLYAPGLGYYTAGRTKFGSAGDFVTAPELGSLFGRCLARAVAPVLRAARGDLLEIGAGTGALAATVLAELAALEALPDRYRILETSADLRVRQAARIAALDPDLSARVEWLNAPPTLRWRGVLLANEVIDALPVRRFVVRTDGLRADAVGVAPDGRFVRAELPADAALAGVVPALLEVSGGGHREGYRSEWLPTLAPWLEAVAGTLESGLALFIDYGHARADYYDPGRRDGTLTCHYRHHVHDDALILPGLQDLTAWVDYTALADAGRALGLELACYGTQADFLFASGLPEIHAESATLDAEKTYTMAQEIKRLTLPSEMGERFKVMAFTRNPPSCELPWTAIDRRESL